MPHQRIQLESRTTVEAAGNWLASFFRRRSLELTQLESCVGLFGLFCAIRVLGSCPSTMAFSDSAQSVIATLLENWTSHQDGSRSEIIDDPVTWLMSAVFAAPDSTETAAYRNAVLERWHSVEEQTTLSSSLHLTLTCRFLSALLDGSSDLPDVSLLDGRVPMLPFSHYLADAAMIQDTLAVLTNLSAYGRLIPKLSQTERRFVEKALPFWTFYYVKERDLDNVCPLARTLKYLHLEALPEYEKAVRYILRQAREDGSFSNRDLSCRFYSYLSPESDMEREIRLPLTVSGIWTLLECLHSSESPFHCSIPLLINS